MSNTNENLLEQLKAARDERIRVVVDSDPQIQRLQGAIDYAEGNIRLREDAEVPTEQENASAGSGEESGSP